MISGTKFKPTKMKYLVSFEKEIYSWGSQDKNEHFRAAQISRQLDLYGLGRFVVRTEPPEFTYNEKEDKFEIKDNVTYFKCDRQLLTGQEVELLKKAGVSVTIHQGYEDGLEINKLTSLTFYTLGTISFVLWSSLLALKFAGVL